MSEKDREFLKTVAIQVLAAFPVFWIPESHQYYYPIGYFCLLVSAVNVAILLREAAPQLRDLFFGDWWY